MKVRWTERSVRIRITPAELETLQAGQKIGAQCALPGGWQSVVVPNASETMLSMQENCLRLAVSPEDMARLSAPDTEGVYFASQTDPPVRYMIEKDFPCLHPRAGEAGEQPTETFAPPPGFEQRKM